MRSTVSTLALFGAIVLSTTVEGGMFLNGSFESQAQAGPSRVSLSNLDNWTSSGGFILLERGVNTTSNIAAADGDQFLSFGHNGASGGLISQTFDTVIGQEYSVDFQIATIQGTGLSTIVASAFDGLNLLGSTTSSTPDNSNDWVAGNTLKFIATSLTSTLQLQNTSGGGFANLALDDVTVTASNSPVVPEPSTMALFGIALAGAGGRVVRRRSTAKS
ncbi:DUF642 domain-containing protein [Thalassoglobus sp. JC818]|uniref:DUF642 domain-containing protein n=1 Tax=Thalassoglobus sp. JC818 TaxID=3232136 RepID=UPI003458B6E9